MKGYPSNKTFGLGSMVGSCANSAALLRLHQASRGLSHRKAAIRRGVPVGFSLTTTLRRAFKTTQRRSSYYSVLIFLLLKTKLNPGPEPYPHALSRSPPPLGTSCFGKKTELPRSVLWLLAQFSRPLAEPFTRAPAPRLLKPDTHLASRPDLATFGLPVFGPSIVA